MSSVTRVVSAGSRGDTVDAVAAAVRQVPSVVDLHGGVMGEIGTYLPKRRVLGVRLRPEATEVHVTLVYGAPVRETASAVRAAVAHVVPGAVDVVVEDVASPPSPSDEAALPGVEPAPALPAAPAAPALSAAPAAPALPAPPAPVSPVT